MAAVDPKELLLRNKVLLGAYVLALVPIALYFVVVTGVKEEFDKKKQALDSAALAAKKMASNITSGSTEEPVFTPKDVETLTSRKQAYEAEYESLIGVINDTGTELEDWFELFKDTPADKTPIVADYQTEWQKQCNALAEKYKAVITGSNGEVHVYNDQPTGDALKKYQKRFWIQQAVLEALTEAQKQNPGLPIRMAAKLDFPAPPGPMVGVGTSPDQPATPPPYEPIPARLTIVCPFPRLPLVMQQLLARKIPMRVTGLRVDKEAFNYEASDPRFAHYNETKPRFSVDGRESTFEQDSYPVTLSDAKHYESQEKWLPEPRVKVELQLEAYDFNKIEKPAADGEGESEEGK